MWTFVRIWCVCTNLGDVSVIYSLDFYRKSALLGTLSVIYSSVFDGNAPPLETLSVIYSPVFDGSMSPLRNLSVIYALDMLYRLDGSTTCP